jgi:hypothetical protein
MSRISTKIIFTIEVNQEEAIELYRFLALHTHHTSLDDLEEELRIELTCNHLIS